MSDSKQSQPKHLDAVASYLADLAALQSHCSEAMEEHSSLDALVEYPAAHSVIERAQTILARHFTETQAELKSLDGDTLLAKAKKMVGSVTGPVAGAISQVRSWPSSKVLRDDYVALSSVAIALTTLHSLSLARAAESTAAMTQRQLAEIADSIVAVSEIIPSVVVDEASKREPVASVADAAERATRQTQEAWRRTS